MKKILFAIVMVSFTAISLFAAPKKKTTPELELEPVIIDLPSIQGQEFFYSFDPRFEIVGLICRLAEYPECMRNYKGENKYLSQMDSFFEKYKDNPFIKQVRTQYKAKGITPDDWVNLTFHIKPDFSGTVVPMDPLPRDLNPAWSKFKPKELNDIVTKIHDFAKESNFARLAILNQGEYLNHLGRLNEEVERFTIHTWGKDFFRNPEIDKVSLVCSYFWAGTNYSTCVTLPENKRQFVVTEYPSSYYRNIAVEYGRLYAMQYAKDNWDIVKDKYTVYEKNVMKKLHPEHEKEIEKKEYTYLDLASYVARFTMLDFLNYRGKNQTEKDIEDFGDYNQTYDSICQSFEKEYGKTGTLGIELLKEYRNNPDKYPDFASFAPKINDFINSLSVE